jgi:hypothetical protein
VLHEDAHCQAAFDPQDAYQQVLRTDCRMQHRLRLVCRVGEDLLRFLGKRQFGGRADAFDEDPLALDLSPDVVRLDVESAEKLADALLALAQDSEQDVLGLDHPAAELGSLVAGEK